jgi:hypothetical protein
MSTTMAAKAGTSEIGSGWWRTAGNATMLCIPIRPVGKVARAGTTVTIIVILVAVPAAIVE